MAIESWKRLTADERKAQLLELGVQLFNSSHYSEISVDDIARAAGISKGLLYHYFPSKEEFFVAGIEHGSRQLVEACDPSPELPLAEQIILGLRGYLDYVEENSFGYRNIFRGETAALPGIVRVCDQARAAIADRFLDSLGLPKDELRCTASAVRSFQGFFEALVLEWLEGRPLERKQVELLAIVSLLTSVYSGLQLDLGAGSAQFIGKLEQATVLLGMLEREYGFTLAL